MGIVFSLGSYALLPIEKDIVAYTSEGTGLKFYRAPAEEFARLFLSNVTIDNHETKLVKDFLLGVLYHECKWSIPELEELPRCKSTEIVHEAVRKYGHLRSIREGDEIAYMRRHGQDLHEGMRKIMKDLWKKDSFREKSSHASSDRMKDSWKKNNGQEIVVEA